MDIPELLEKADKKLFKVHLVDPDCIAHLVTSFQRRKKQSINLETKLLITWRLRLTDLRMYS